MVSKVGKNPISVPSGVTIDIRSGEVLVSGPKGTLSVGIPDSLLVAEEGSQLKVGLEGKEQASLAVHGLVRTLLANAVFGVTSGWTRSLEMVGTGYRAALAGANLSLSVGFSHAVIVSPPEGIVFSVDGNKIVVAGIDKQKVGKVASEIRLIRPPEPYKGKGIKYLEEKVRRKPGKAAKAAVGATGAK